MTTQTDVANGGLMSSPLRVEDLYVTPEDFLAAEELSETKHEYVAGIVYAMAGGSWSHNQIAMNIGSELHSQLRGKRCNVMGSDQMLRVESAGAAYFYYPDITVDCSGAREIPTREPSVLFEILSPSTDRADRSEKWYRYQTIPSLRVYVLVDQARFALTVYRRETSGDWRMEVVGDSHGALELPEIGCTLPLAQIYDRVLPAA